MSDDPRTSGDARSPDEIREEIEHTREELAQTASALAEKADVKARAHDKVDETKARITGKVTDLKDKAADSSPPKVGEAATSAQQTVKEHPFPAAVAGAFVAGFVVAWVLKRR